MIFYSNQGSFMEVNDIKDIIKSFISSHRENIDELKELFKYETKPDKPCDISRIEFYYRQMGGGSKYFFRDGFSSNKYEEFDLYYLIKDIIIPRIEKEKEGSGIKSTKFFEELKKMDIDIDQYLKQIKANAKKNKYDPKLIDWAYDDVHKLKYFSPEGVKKFGRVGYKDLLIYKQLEKLGKVEKGTAEKMKKRFHKSHEAISKKNKLSVYSPNELALNVLW